MVHVWLAKGFSPRAFSDELSTLIKGFAMVSFVHSVNENLRMKEMVECRLKWDFQNINLSFTIVFQRLEHKEVLVGLVFLVFPASNLFFRMGFVVAERVLYMPRWLLLVISSLRDLPSVTNTGSSRGTVLFVRRNQVLVELRCLLSRLSQQPQRDLGSWSLPCSL